MMIDKALKGDVNARKVRVDASGKSAIKEMAGAFLGGLLGRPELSGTMREKAVKAAIRCWVGHLDGVALSMCSSSDTPSKHLIVPKQPLKRQLKMLHPSCAGDQTPHAVSSPHAVAPLPASRAAHHRARSWTLCLRVLPVT